ncbi:MAG: hypothetical protein COU29_03385 [Candidatus Magasanikbacteria bacterium CG10_big_fil_rev_8_21_14_0_10_36_32]|uniref:Clp R domain-containing protein n=1 Tax=Candidatus Magasanikbacteria bacterium CG10_big_fil_rev_8_21_14_0_10_36_32 TaxID=1974646 RepID=A0A2M6W644_9BACT|nr:MAG: hypothetical protein COU29_03385 [Candidatus Magasanikbacteria bacterium CG10_big_fil_rev_8_21_14_0_10_36_32]
MLFEKKQPLNLLICPSCKGTGIVGMSGCSECRGKSVGYRPRQKLLHWSFPLTRYNLALLKAKRIFNKIRRITFVVLWLNAWGWFGFLIYKKVIWADVIKGPEYMWNALNNVEGSSWILFWLGVIFISYWTYRVITERKIKGEVEKYSYDVQMTAAENQILTDWKQIEKISGRQSLNISSSFTDEALAAVGEAYEMADRNGYKILEVEHLFFALLSFNRIGNIFVRLGIPASVIKKYLLPILENKKGKVEKRIGEAPLVSPDFFQALFGAYEESYSAHQEYVSVTELLVAAAKQSEMLQEMLYDVGIEKNKLVNAVEWARIGERLYRRYVTHSRSASHRSKSGMDKAMTALATPYLNNFSDDMTLLAQYGRLEFCVARDKVIEEVFRAVEGGGENVVLVGEHGAGKRSVVEGIAEKMINEDVPSRLRDKRLVRLSVSSLLSGTTPAGAIERLLHILNEISNARNVVLFIHNIHEMSGVSAGEEGGSLDLSDTLAERLKTGRFITIATTTPEFYAKNISGTSLSNIFTKVDVKELTEDEAIQVVESKIGLVEYKNKVFFAYNAIEKAVQLASRYLHEVCLPGSALEVINESAAHVRNKKGNESLVTAEDVAKVVSDKTGIPVTSVTADESGKLMKLEQEMHKRVIGQEEAVGLIANALRRARAQIRSTNRPIANFLFLGPTGVGKTELAKTISTVYFGGEDMMVRLDMSEYQDKTSVYRLIGAPGEKGSGILTEAVRRQPFSLLLLDEIEKADPNILNLFLQVMDDGRLTDSSGQVIDFTNVILIATSNAGTTYVQEQMRAGLSSEAIKERLLHGELKQNFRPEFLNRFDGIVLFKPLAYDDVKKIAALMLQRITKELEEKGIETVIEDEALDFLAGVGFDPEFGARPLRRAIQERIENQLAEMLLSNKLKRRDKIAIGRGGYIRVIN